MNRNVPMTLTLEEYVRARRVGLRRMSISSARGDNHAKTYQRSNEQRAIDETIGACAELLVCRLLGLDWNEGVDTFHEEADAGHGIEVRGTRLAHGSLIYRPHEPLYRNYVLVTGEVPYFTVRGYIWGPEACRDEWRRDPHGHGRPSWFVPQAALKAVPA